MTSEVIAKVTDALLALGVDPKVIEEHDLANVPDKALRGVVAHIVTPDEHRASVGMSLTVSALVIGRNEAYAEIVRFLAFGIESGVYTPQQAFDLAVAVATGTALATPENDQRYPGEFLDLAAQGVSNDEALDAYDKLREVHVSLKGLDAIQRDISAIESDPDAIDWFLDDLLS